jgi:membrane dipeptidase
MTDRRQDFPDADGAATAFAAEGTKNQRALRASPDLHRDAIVVDCHNDLIMTCAHLAMLRERATFAQRWIPELRAGGVDVQVVPIWTESTNPESSLRMALQHISAFYREVDANASLVAACGTGSEIHSAVAAGRIAMILALEGASCLGNEPSLVALFFRLGVRMISFTHYGRSWLADGSGENDTGGRLTRAGVATLAEMERLGIVADVSHLGLESTRHLVELATRPVVASHSSARALRDHHRNLTDEQIRAIAATGGVVGVNVFPAYIDPERPTIRRVGDHVEHIANVAGPQHVGLGPDFIVEIYDDIYPPHAQLGTGTEGIDPRQRIDGLHAPRHLPALTEELIRRGFSDGVIRDILGRNFLRVFDEVLGRPPSSNEVNQAHPGER